MILSMTYAFRCKTCGHLHEPEHAGENDLPHACRVCGEGVEFSRKGKKTFNKDNWEVLHSATDDRLSEIQLKREHVCKHDPKKVTKGREPQTIKVSAQDGVLTSDNSQTAVS